MLSSLPFGELINYMLFEVDGLEVKWIPNLFHLSINYISLKYKYWKQKTTLLQSSACAG